MRKILAFVSTSLLTFTVNAASFDCKKASTPVEKAICTDSTLSKLDEDMTVAYKKAVEVFPIKGFIQAWQKFWLSNIRTTCYKKQCSAEDVTALISSYQMRIKQLSVSKSDWIFTSEPNDLTFEKTPSVVIIRKENERIFFTAFGSEGKGPWQRCAAVENLNVLQKGKEVVLSIDGKKPYLAYNEKYLRFIDEDIKDEEYGQVVGCDGMAAFAIKTHRIQ